LIFYWAQCSLSMLTVIGSDGLQHRSSWPVNNTIPLPPSYLSSLSSDVSPYSLTPSGYPLQHSADAMVGFLLKQIVCIADVYRWNKFSVLQWTDLNFKFTSTQSPSWLKRAWSPAKMWVGCGEGLCHFPDNFFWTLKKCRVLCIFIQKTMVLVARNRDWGLINPLAAEVVKRMGGWKFRRGCSTPTTPLSTRTLPQLLICVLV